MPAQNSAPGAATGTAPLPPMHCLRHVQPGPPRLAALPTGTPVWVVSRHADVRQVLTDPRLNRSALYETDAPPLTLIPNILDDPQSMLNIDGTDHQRLRRTVQRAFTPRAIARWRPWVASVVESLIDELIDGGSPADIVSAYTRPLPVAVIGRLMGLDNLDSQRIGHWSDHALSTTAYTAEEIGTAMGEFAAFGRQVIAERRDAPGDDLVSSLIAAAEDGSMSEGQLVTLVIGLVVAGHETTMTSLGNALVYLLEDGRDAWGRLAADEASASAATEQLLRGVPLGDATEHMPGLLRRAVEEVEIGGVLIPAGSVVAADTKAANQDPGVFTSDLLTELFSPLAAPSLTFGAGPHHCLGAWLARMELELALHRLARRLPSMRLAEPVEGVDWRRGLLTRSPNTLKVAW